MKRLPAKVTGALLTVLLFAGLARRRRAAGMGSGGIGGASGVREPRRPLQPSGAGTAAVEPPG